MLFRSVSQSRYVSTSIPLFVSILFLFSISFLANSVYFSSDFLLNVNVINLHLSWLFLNSFSSLMYHSPAFFFLHSSQYPHPIGTNFILSSIQWGITPPFFYFFCILDCLLMLGKDTLSSTSFYCFVFWSAVSSFCISYCCIH